MSSKRRQDPADPFPLIVWDESSEGQDAVAIAVEEPPVVEAPTPLPPPAAIPAPQVESKSGKKKKNKKGKKGVAVATPAPARAVGHPIDWGFWFKAALAIGGAAFAAGLVAAVIWWRRPKPETPVETPLGTPQMVAAIQDVEKTFVKAPETPEPATHAGLRYGYAAGDLLTSEFEFVQNVTLGTSALFANGAERRGETSPTRPADVRLGYRLGGRAELAVYESGEKIAVGWRFSRMSLDLRGDDVPSGNAKLDALRAELNREVLVDMTPLGKIEALHFPAEMSAWARSLLSAVITTTRMSFPEKESPAWTATEEDAMGRYTAAYSAEGGYSSADGRATRISRTRKGVDAIVFQGSAGAGTFAADSCRVTLEGGSVGLFDPDHGRFRTFRTDEKIRIQGVEFAQDVTSTTAGGMRLTGAARDENLAENGHDLAEALRKKSEPARPGTADLAARMAMDAESARLKALTGGMSIEQAIQALQEKVARGEMDSEEASELGDRLVAILRLDPAAVAVALEIVRQGTANLAVRIVLTDALGAAETKPAGEALVEIVKDSSLAAEIRQNALTGLAMADEPVAGALATTRDVVAAGAADPASEAALLGFGMLARKAVARDASQSTALAETLLDASRRSSDPQWLGMLLEAYGNAGLRETLPEIRKFLGRDDVKTRARATFALRFIDDPEADVILARAIRGDASPDVRFAAVEALTFRSSNESRSALETAMGDDVPEIRAAAAKALGRS